MGLPHAMLAQRSTNLMLMLYLLFVGNEFRLIPPTLSLSINQALHWLVGPPHKTNDGIKKQWKNLIRNRGWRSIFDPEVYYLMLYYLFFYRFHPCSPHPFQKTQHVDPCPTLG